MKIWNYTSTVPPLLEFLETPWIPQNSLKPSWIWKLSINSTPSIYKTYIWQKPAKASLINLAFWGKMCSFNGPGPIGKTTLNSYWIVGNSMIISCEISGNPVYHNGSYCTQIWIQDWYGPREQLYTIIYSDLFLQYFAGFAVQYCPLQLYSWSLWNKTDYHGNF